VNIPAAEKQIVTLLSRLTPPATVVHVGAGAGTGYLHQWHTWELTRAIVVDASMEKLAWAEAKSGHDGTWHAINAVVGARNEQRPFYTAGNPDENSLVPPTSLQYIWPGLNPAGQSDVQVQTLDTAIESAGIPIPQDNTWLLIDCFCAADIVQGTAGLLPACSLVCARVLNNDSDPEEELLYTSTLEAMASLLEPLGFRFVHLHPGLNPAAGHAFFVRDWHAHAQEQKGQVQQITEQKNAVQQQLTEKEKQHTETANQLKQKNDAAAALTKERDELKQKTADANHHQQLLQEELTRAEAQIDLIKDLLLREQGLGE